MALACSNTPNVTQGGAMPSAPCFHHHVDLAFLAGDTYATGGLDITAAFAAAYPGETVVQGSTMFAVAGGTVRIFQLVPGATLKLWVFEENAGTLRQVPNGTNLAAYSPVTFRCKTQ